LHTSLRGFIKPTFWQIVRNTVVHTVGRFPSLSERIVCDRRFGRVASLSSAYHVSNFCVVADERFLTRLARHFTRDRMPAASPQPGSVPISACTSCFSGCTLNGADTRTHSVSDRSADASERCNIASERCYNFADDWILICGFIHRTNAFGHSIAAASRAVDG
jgi:hypothetical protein